MIMTRQDYIISFASPDEDRVYTAFLSRGRVIFIASMAMALFLVCSIVLSRALNWLRMDNQMQNIQAENSVLKKTFAAWENRTRDIETQLNDLKQRNTDIRVAAALPVPEDRYAAGGPESNLRMGFLEVSETKKTELNISKLEHEMDWLKNDISQLEQNVSSRMMQISHYPSILPVRGGYISSPFGKRIDPFTGIEEAHYALDISIEPGSEVFATGAGIVKIVNRNVVQYKGYGNYIIIDHGFGYETMYGHLSKIFVKEGQRVNRWDLIGLSGNTGKSTAPHLHYGVFANGEPKNPVNFILE
jgi:murein DD-endopeptidase MepM/ murein hydrolase activator NlpD